MSMLAPANHGHVNPQPTSITGQFQQVPTLSGRDEKASMLTGLCFAIAMSHNLMLHQWESSRFLIQLHCVDHTNTCS